MRVKKGKYCLEVSGKRELCVRFGKKFQSESLGELKK